MAFELPPLPYDRDALEPHMSSRTFDYHYGKHHQAYVTKLNGLIEGTDLDGKSLEDIILVSAGKADMTGVFNNAAQVWNHTFFWNSMKPNGGGRPAPKLAEMIDTAFGSYDNFVEKFKAAAAGQFGSGWAWLVLDEGALKIVTTANAETPLTQGMTPLLTCDVWEHAYYLDYQNDRPGFVGVFLDKLVNWDFAAAQLT